MLERVGWGIARNIGRANCRAASVSAWPSRGRWSCARRCVLADEPTGNLDGGTADTVVQPDAGTVANARNELRDRHARSGPRGPRLRPAGGCATAFYTKSRPVPVMTAGGRAVRGAGVGLGRTGLPGSLSSSPRPFTLKRSCRSAAHLLTPVAQLARQVMWIDTHCHLDASEFDADREHVARRREARASGVS